MIYTRTNNYGIDHKIAKIQNYLNDNLGWNDMHIYGRLSLNNINSKAVGSTTSAGEIVPEWYLENKDEYVQVFVNDKVASVCGFVVRERTYSPQSAEVDIIFSVNMDKIYSSKGREDERARMEVIRAIEKCNLIQSINTINDGIDNVYSGFDKAGLEYRNMQPFFNFSLSCTIPYINKIC